MGVPWKDSDEIGDKTKRNSYTTKTTHDGTQDLCHWKNRWKESLYGNRNEGNNRTEETLTVREHQKENGQSTTTCCIRSPTIYQFPIGSPPLLRSGTFIYLHLHPHTINATSCFPKLHHPAHMPTMANPSAPSSNGVNPSSSSSTPASTPYRSLSLSDLRDRSKIRVSSPNDYSAKSWLVNARRCASEARIADTQNRIEEAFVGYLRACGFFEMFLNHKSYPKIKSEGSGNPSWHEYTEFSQHRAEYLARAKELSKVLAERDVEKERYGHGHDHDHDHGLVSQHAEPARAQADLAQAQAQAQSQVSPPETQAAQATSPTDSSTDTKGGGSIAARLMALRGAGMEVGTNNKRFTRDLVTPVVKEDVHSPVIYEERENQREHEQGHGHGQGNGHGIHSDSSSRKDSMALPMEPTPAASRGGSSASGNTTNTTSNEGGILTPRLENMKLTNSEMNPNRTGSSVRSVRSIEKAQPQHLSSSPSLTADNFNNLNSSHNTHPSYLINHDNINHDKLNHYKNVDNLDKNSSPDNVNVNDDLNTFPSPSRPAITIPTSGNENERVRESCEHPSPPASLNILSPTYATAESPREQLHFGYSHEAGPTSPASHTQAQGQGQNQHSFSLNELDFRSPVPKPERQNSTGPGSGSGPGGGSDGGGHKLDHSPPRRPATREEDDVMAHFVSSFPSLDDFEENPVYSVPTSAQTAGSGSSKSQSQSQPQPQPRPDSRSNSRDGPIVVISTEEETEFGLPSLPSVPKSVPGSVSRSGTGAGAGLGPGPSPPSANELLAAGVPNRPSSLPPPHIPLSPSSTLNGQTSPLSTSPSNGLHSPFPAAKHPPPVPPHTHAHAHASVPVPSSSRPLPKPNLPYTNAITPAQLNEYLHNPALKILIIDTRTQEEFNKDYVGKDMDFGGRKVNIVWIDPTILLRHGLDSTKLESALALLPSAEQKAFIDRTQNDLVVIYDASSKGFPPKGAFPTAPSLLSSIIFENEFRKTLPRCPVLLVGGYEAWKEEIKLRGGKQSTRAFGRNLINGQEHGSRAPPPLIPPTKPLHSPSASLPGGADTSRLRRDGAIHRSPGYSRNITDNFGGAVPQSMAGVGSSYTSQPMITAYTPPNKSRSGSLSAYDHFNGGPSPPPQASIGPGLLARKRSDYIDHHGQPYTGYVGHSPKTSIDYPTPRSGPIPPPPVAVTPGLERHDSRPPHAPRSASIISFDGLSKLPDFDDMLYWNDVGLGISGLKNLGK